MKYALIGEKLGHSYSRIIHEKYFKYKSINAAYDLIEIAKDELTDKVSVMASQGYTGFNVTIPYKIELMKMCSSLSSEASDIGAVNTVKLSGRQMHGYNTDYHGLRLALDVNKIDIKDKNVVILGTGGASAAVRTLCRDLSCAGITLVSRETKSDGEYKVLTYSDKLYGDVIINTTPVGMYPNTEKSPTDDFSSFETAVDLTYNPAETLFLKKASEAGLKTVNGLYMLVAQALYSQSIWHNNDVDYDMIDKIYNEMKVEIQ